jgi:hypothetical protein
LADAASSASLGSVECAGGYSIENNDARKLVRVCGIIVMGLAGIWALLIACLVCRIQLAIKINQVACEFMYKNRSVILVPIIQAIIGVLWVFLWIFCATFLLSQVPKDAVPTTSFKTYAEAYGTSDTAGKCTDTWPSGDVYVDTSNNNTECTVDFKCYKCSPPRFQFGYPFLYQLFSFFWHNFFIVAVGQCTVAGAVGLWFFTQDKSQVLKGNVCSAWKNAVLWHTGSLAFGSFILAIIVTVKWVMHWLAEQSKAQKNKVMECVCRVLVCVIWCFEKCVKFLNKNAYIQVALMGTNFCRSAKNAFWLIARNAIRFMVVTMLSNLVHFIAMALIIVLTAFSGYGFLQLMYEDVNPVAPVIAYVIIGYFTAKLFVGTFGMAVDATLQCFIAAEEMGKGNEFAPEQLRSLIPEEGHKKGCCDSMCTVL